jgi:hypothetical protein
MAVVTLKGTFNQISQKKKKIGPTEQVSITLLLLSAALHEMNRHQI